MNFDQNNLNSNLTNEQFNDNPNLTPNATTQQPIAENYNVFNNSIEPQTSTITPVIPTETPTNIFEGNNGNQISTNPSPNKNKLWLIIGIVAVIVIGVIVAIKLFDKEELKDQPIKDTSINKTEEKVKGDKIDDISITTSDMVVLSDKGDLYHVGDNFAFLGADYEDLEKKATDVVSFYNNNSAVYYIDSQSDLYYWGASYNAGSTDEAQKDYNNVKDINVYMNFCALVITNDNELHIKNNGYGMQYCGLNKSFSEFTKVADNVQEVFTGMFYSGYITYNGELYVSTADANYIKVMDNVKTAQEIGYNDYMILTTDNKLYLNVKNAEVYELVLIKENVSELGEYNFKTSDGKYYVFSDREEVWIEDAEYPVLYEGSSDSTLYYGELPYEDIKNVLYYVNTRNIDMESSGFPVNKQQKLIYLSNNDELILIDENGKETLKYTTENITKIFDFVTKKNLIED